MFASNSSLQIDAECALSRRVYTSAMHGKTRKIQVKLFFLDASRIRSCSGVRCDNATDRQTIFTPMTMGIEE